MLYYRIRANIKSKVMSVAGSFAETPWTHCFGWFGVAHTISAGTTIGTFLSKSAAALLEELDVFIP